MSISVQSSSNGLPVFNDTSSQEAPVHADSPVDPLVKTGQGFPADGSSANRLPRSIDRLGRGQVETHHHHYPRPTSGIYGKDEDLMILGLAASRIKALQQTRDDLSRQIGEKRGQIQDIDEDPNKTPSQKKSEQHRLYKQIEGLVDRKKKIDDTLDALKPPPRRPSRTRFPAGTRYG